MPQYPNAVSAYQALRGGVFVAANPTAVTTSAGLATTYVGIVLSNPAASTKALNLRRVSGAMIVAPAAGIAYGLITGYAAAGVTVHTTPLVTSTSLIGAATPAVGQGLVDSAATLVGTPVWSMFFGGNTTPTSLVSFSEDILGRIQLRPGAYAAIGTTVAGPTAGFMGAFEWEEVAL